MKAACLDFFLLLKNWKPKKFRKSHRNVLNFTFNQNLKEMKQVIATKEYAFWMAFRRRKHKSNLSATDHWATTNKGALIQKLELLSGNRCSTASTGFFPSFRTKHWTVNQRGKIAGNFEINGNIAVAGHCRFRLCCKHSNGKQWKNEHKKIFELQGAAKLLDSGPPTSKRAALQGA